MLGIMLAIVTWNVSGNMGAAVQCIFEKRQVKQSVYYFFFFLFHGLHGLTGVSLLRDGHKYGRMTLRRWQPSHHVHGPLGLSR